MSSDKTVSPRTKEVLSANDYADMVKDIAKGFPHQAVRTKSPKTPCYFYNVYLKESIQEELNGYTVADHDAWTLLSVYGVDNLNVQVKQKNIKGFYQVIASYSIGEGEWNKRETHMMTAEAGTRERAIVKSFTYHMLVWNAEAGIWMFTDKLMRDKDDF